MTRRLNDATPEEHDAVNYYKKLDERLPDDFWDDKPAPSVVKDDNWDEDRVDTIGQNGNTGEHYLNRDYEEIANSVDATQKLIDSLKKTGTTANSAATDNISKPKHYMLFDFEVIDLIYEILSKEEFSGYCLGNVLKYRLRAGKKDDALEDLAKANEYEKIWERYYGAN